MWVLIDWDMGVLSYVTPISTDIDKTEKRGSLYLVLVSTEQFSEQRSSTIRGPNRLGQHSSLMQVFRQKSATWSAVRTISTVAL